MASTSYCFGLLGIFTFSLIFCSNWLAFYAEGGKNVISFHETSKAVQLGFEAITSLLSEKRGQAIWSVLHDSKKVKEKAIQSEMGLLIELLKSVGMEPGKVANLAFGGLISLVQLVSQILTERKSAPLARKRRGGHEFSFFSFLIEQPQVAKLMSRMQEPNLVDSLLEEVEPTLLENLEKNEHCVSALLCKTTPFVNKMQKSLQFFLRHNHLKESCLEELHVGNSERATKCKEDILWENSNTEERLYFFVPTLEEVVDQGQECDQRFPNCNY